MTSTNNATPAISIEDNLRASWQTFSNAGGNLQSGLGAVTFGLEISNDDVNWERITTTETVGLGVCAPAVELVTRYIRIRCTTRITLAGVNRTARIEVVTK